MKKSVNACFGRQDANPKHVGIKPPATSRPSREPRSRGLYARVFRVYILSGPSSPHNNANFLLTNSRISDDYDCAARRCDGCDTEVLDPMGFEDFLFLACRTKPSSSNITNVGFLGGKPEEMCASGRLRSTQNESSRISFINLHSPEVALVRSTGATSYFFYPAIILSSGALMNEKLIESLQAALRQEKLLSPKTF
jgi:hypothetical protein